MTIEEATNRGNNLLATGLLAVLAAGVVPVAFIENEWIDRVDDIVIGVIAVVAIAWYVWGRNRLRWSIMPAALVGLGLIMKAVTVFATEATDVNARGDDIGVMVGFAVALALVGWQVWRARPSRT
jgi:peptidoglycan/LPS O-acetylase OafA/YrhL